SNVFGTAEAPVADWTFTAYAGLRLIVPFGPKVFFRGSALPSYTWYDKLVDRRSFGGYYDASFYGFFNRMTVQLSGYGSQSFELYSSELQTRVKTNIKDGYGLLDVQLGGPWSLWGRGEVQVLRYSNEGQLPGSDVNVNNRTDSAARGGLRYKVSDYWDLTA